MRNPTHLVRLFLLIVSASLLFSGCKIIGRNTASGAIEGIKKENTDAYIENLVSRVVENTRSELLNETTRKQVDSLLTVVTHQLKTSADTMGTTLRDSLLSDYTTLRIKKIILEAGDAANSSVDQLLNKTVYPSTTQLINDIKAELLGDSTLKAVGAIRDELLGDKTEARVDSLIRSAIVTLASEYEKSLKPQLTDLLKTTNKEIESTIDYLVWAFGIAAFILLLLCAFLYRKFSMRNRITKIITEEVDRISDQRVYDEVVKNISSRTKQENVARELDAILKKHALYQQKEWVDKDQQLLAMLAQKHEGDQQLMQQLQQMGLQEHFESVKNR